MLKSTYLNGMDQFSGAPSPRVCHSVKLSVCRHYRWLNGLVLDRCIAR